METVQKAIELAADDTRSDADVLTVAKGGGITFFGSLLEYVFRFAFSIVITRSVGAEQFGLYSLALIITSFASVFANLGLPQGVVRFVPIFAGERDEAGLRGLLQAAGILTGSISLFFAVGMFALAGPLSERLFHEPGLAPLLRLTSIGVPLITLTDTIVAATRGFKKMHYKVYAQDIVFQTVKFVLTGIALGLGLGVFGALGAQNIALVVSTGLLFYFLHRLFPLNRSFGLARWDVRELLRFSLPLYFGQLIGHFGGDIATLLLGVMDTTVSVGVYSVAYRVSVVGRMFLLSIGLVAMPVVSDLYHRKDYIQLGSLYRTATKWSLSFNLPFFLMVLLFARPLLSIFGSDFGAGALGLIILSFGILADAGIGIPGVLVSMTGHSRLHLFNSIAAVITTLVLGVLLIPRYGVLGAATATASALVLDNTLALSEVYILYRLWPYDRSFLKPLIAGLISVLITLIVNRWVPTGLSLSFGLVFNVAVMWLSYAIGLLLLGISKEDKLIISTLRARLDAIVRGR